MRWKTQIDQVRTINRLVKKIADQRDAAIARLDAVTAERDALANVVAEVSVSGVESELRQYLTVQIDRELWDQIQRITEDKEIQP